MEPIEAQFIGIETKQGRIKRKDAATGLKVNDKEIIYIAKFQMKKIAYDKDENVKEDTNDPWLTFSIKSKRKDAFSEYENSPMGAPVVITVDKA